MKNKPQYAAAFLFLVLTLFSFRKDAPSNTVDVEIEAVFGEKKLILEKEVYINQNGDSLYIDLFRFYLSDLRLTYENGDIYKEKNSFHLIDAESGNMNFSLQGVPSGKVISIDFLIGVDSAASVSGALEGDLDPAKGMYWAWNSGYIYGKLEGRSPKCPTLHHAFEFHVGGYLSKENAARKISLPLKNPKVINDESKLKITADAAVWLRGIKLSETHHVMTPGTQAMQMADRYMHMFKISE